MQDILELDRPWSQTCQPILSVNATCNVDGSMCSQNARCVKGKCLKCSGDLCKMGEGQACTGTLRKMTSLPYIKATQVVEGLSQVCDDDTLCYSLTQSCSPGFQCQIPKVQSYGCVEREKKYYQYETTIGDIAGSQGLFKWGNGLCSQVGTNGKPCIFKTEGPLSGFVCQEGSGLACDLSTNTCLIPIDVGDACTSTTPASSFCIGNLKCIGGTCQIAP